MFILPGNVLLVNQATTADFGSYKCTASNPYGTAQSTSYGKLLYSIDFNGNALYLQLCSVINILLHYLEIN